MEEKKQNKFIFHNVGQGLFYSGHLHNNQFNFIYDCGSVSKAKYLENAINNQLPATAIDFMVISHLHQDHINGLKRLLINHHVHKIFLPYLGHGNLSLVKLLTARALFTSDDNDFFDESMFRAFRFIVDFYDINVQGRNRDTEVVFIGQNGEPVMGSGDIHSQIEFADSKGEWKFIMYNKRCSNSTLDSLESAINAELKKHRVSNVTDLIRKGRIKDIKDIYNAVFKKGGIDLNLTSTILIHYPVGKKKFHYPYRFVHTLYEIESDRTKPITVLTGDAIFDDEMLLRLNQELLKHTDAFLVFQVPHHGSKYNWHSLTIDYKYIFNQYVIPFGLGNKYHHPHKEVINELSILKTAAVSMVTEITAFQYYIL